MIYSKTGSPVVATLLALGNTIGSQYAREWCKTIAGGSYSTTMPNPDAYPTAQAFAYDYALHASLKKFKGAADQHVLHDEAISKFRDFDSSIGNVNRKLRYQATNVEGIISDSRRKIASILGSFNRSEWLELCDWGPGATSTLKGERARLDEKILEPRLSVTPSAFKYAQALLASTPAWMSARLTTGQTLCGPYSPFLQFELVSASRLTTVEKDYRARRTIDIQPTMNLYLQKGIGSMIRRRLKARSLINLDSQSRNQWMASVAQKLGYATIDLASASDSISSELVRLLLPPDWFEHLNDLRTQYTRHGDEEPIYLQKFSSMGNGYTFELESLIFYALAYAVVVKESDCAVDTIGIYGDDIVVPNHCALRLIQVLEELGFKVNTEKSFLKGRFYESCGQHYFDGQDVTPFYQKEEVVDAPSAIRFANRLYRWAARMGSGVVLDDVAASSWQIAVDLASRYHYDFNERRLQRHVSAKKRTPFQRLPLPTLPHYAEGDSGLLGIDETCLVSGWFSKTKPVPGSEVALLSDALAKGRPEASYGLVTIRGDGKYHFISKKRIPWKCGRASEWMNLRFSTLS